ncbi:transcriptional regulator family: Fungal Specific TF [Trichoderma harzianum]|nr:transcriptional regulator family: Fungal Specific TF [Trichoderma harzianum]
MYFQILTSNRNGGKCEYPSGLRPSNAHSSLIALQAQQRVVQQPFPPSFFLDMNIFRQARLELPRPSLAVPAYVSDFLGGDEEVRQMVTTFFTSESPKSPAYIAAKQFFFELENAGNLSIRLVQAGIFIALYELGHCIYPAAYMSVGTCARHAVALGLDKDIKQSNATGLPWDDIEERRRVWWAILILDRFINLGNPPRMLATADPATGDILPADDASWEQGLLHTTELFTIGSQSQLRMGRFARFAQATYLLGQVIRHVSDEPRDDAFYVQEAAQLNRTLHALIHLSQSEAETRSLEFCTQTAACYM